MDIKYKNYELRQVDVASNRFDLYKTGVETVVRNAKMAEKFNSPIGSLTGELRDDVIGYGYTIEAGMQQIALEELSKNKSVVPITEFLNEYKMILNDILKTV